ncbi:DnaD domain-containing protein [Paenibacillus taiwanensis]|uniref:DnaD domain-containing protein n=1 Tax=Paenibacillus taiwanensis TaxID=401638 RepID=UPI0003F4C0C6|nr:DnaD domain-containing protein [Paenibacillus taiwanensis]
MSGEAYRAYAKGISHALMTGQVSLPYLLLKHYKQLGLTDTDTMVIIHLSAFKQSEWNDFPTIEEIQERMSVPASHVITSLQRMMKDGFLTIDEEIEPESGVQFERYNLTGLYDKLGHLLTDEAIAERKRQRAAGAAAGEQESLNLFEIFEKEFGRPLSPMEYETIAGWIDDDRYPLELILLALKEAVFAGKIHFRYIDRILLEWSRNKIQTVEEARAHTQKFRGSR